jgi:hypothetical protein
MNENRLAVLGLLLCLIFLGLFGYTYYGEYEMRRSIAAPPGTNYGLIPVDLLLGRTHFEKRSQGKVVFSLDAGPKGEGRTALARAAAGVGALSIATFAFGYWRRKQSTSTS